jgi:hypothetical protein
MESHNPLDALFLLSSAREMANTLCPLSSAPKVRPSASL